MYTIRTKYEEGQQMGDCTYISDVPDRNGRRYGLFKCQCGNTFTASIGNVKRRQVKVCSIKCSFYKRNLKTHRQSKTKVYSIWCSLKGRCTNTTDQQYKNYGGRGIKVCDRWLNSFENFLEDMGERPSPKHSIDRIDVNGNYEPNNCRWATWKEQANNTRRNHIITWKGETKTLQQWAELTGLNQTCIRHRLKLKWDVEKTLTTPSGLIRNNGFHKAVINTTTGIYYDSIRDAANAHKIKERTLHSWLTGKNINKSPLELV